MRWRYLRAAKAVKSGKAAPECRRERAQESSFGVWAAGNIISWAERLETCVLAWLCRDYVKSGRERAVQNKATTNAVALCKGGGAAAR